MSTELNENTSNSYIASGSEDQFEIRFKWYEQDEVQVSTNGTVITAGFSVVVDQTSEPDNGNDSDVVAYVVFDSNPASGTIILLEQELNISQETEYTEFGNFKAKAHEYALDKLTLLIKKVNGLLSTLTDQVADNESELDTISSGIINIDNSINALEVAATQAASDLAALTQSVDDLETATSGDIILIQQDLSNFEISLQNQSNVIQGIAAIIDENARDKRTAVNISGGIHDVFTSIVAGSSEWSGVFPASEKTLNTDLKKIHVHYNGDRLLSGYSVTGRTLNLTINVSGTDQLLVDYEES